MKNGTEYPDLVPRNVSSRILSAKPSPKIRVTDAVRQSKRTKHLTVPFLRWGISPHFSVSAFADHVPYVIFNFNYNIV